MENTPNPSRNPMPPKSQFVSSSGGAGVCVMNVDWKNGQDTSFISFISSFLSSNLFRLIHAPIGPDLIFNFGGLSVAFLFVTAWDYNFAPNIFRRVQYLKEEFAHFYVILTLQTKEQNDSFVRSYFKYVMEFGRPTFIPVPDREMGFEKIAKIALSLGVSKQQNATSKLKAEKRQLMQRMDLFLGIVTSIPGIDNHDANALNQAIGSIEAIAKASKEDILDKTDLSPEKADVITTFFREPKFYLGPKLS